jgi:phosphoribosylaminoimidazole-succinocarboxamide synthase
MPNKREPQSPANSELPPTLATTHFEWLGQRYEGKVRDSYTRDGLRFLVATDRLSAFDRVLTTVPLKGQVLTQIAQFWFERFSGLIPHHVVASPDPCVTVAREVSIVPIEVIVRGYLAGGGWRDYQAGRNVSGVTLRSGLQEFDELPEPILTPSTKAPMGNHDLPISEAEIVKKGLVSAQVWDEVRSHALTLFTTAARELRGRGLIFVDTKYEFGLLDGKVVLADEIHTLDSSRFWVAESYEEHRRSGRAPEMLDKEPIRRWLLAQGFNGEGEIPVIGDDYRAELMKHYISSFERITGTVFCPNVEEPSERIAKNLKQFLGLD